jgi:aryl-alcohol dehydrogenase-like predicted oxidoreductase
MEYTTLGDTGLTVSRICLGCMSFGSTDWHEWVLGEAESRPIIEEAIDLGINFFDTANEYSVGESERILGSVLAEYDPDWPVVSTKGFYSTDESNPNAQGLSRKAIERALEESLDRLGMETIDLYQIHRWDYETPIEETLRALDDAVRRGQVRYLGASSMWAYQFTEALHTADRLGLDRFVSMENHYNLTYREEEREMLPLCEREGIGVMCWSPLARGYLTRPHEHLLETFRGRYMDTDSHKSRRVANYRANGGDEINERVEELAARKGVTMAQISLAWLLHQDVVDAPIVGVTSVEHLEDAVEALDVDLSEDELAYLEDPYGPVEVNGHH